MMSFVIFMILVMALMVCVVLVAIGNACNGRANDEDAEDSI